MTTRNVLNLSLGLVIACLLCIWFVDQPLAFFIDRHLRGSRSFFSAITTFGEIITGFPISKYLPALVMLVAGLVMLAVGRRFTRANVFFFIGLTFLLSRFTAGVLKPMFERTRPFDLVSSPHHGSTFFIDGGTSFPSGHAAHFWGLFFPLILIFPALRFPLAILPVAICIARVAVNDHYPSDVIASTVLALLLAAASAKVFRVLQPQKENQVVETLDR